MRIGIPAPARVRPRGPGPIVPSTGDLYYGAGDFYRRRIRPAGRTGRRLVGLLLPWILAVGLAFFLQFIIRNWPVYRVVTLILFIFTIPLMVKCVELTVIINYIFISGLVGIPKPVTFGGMGFKPHELLILIGVAIATFGFYARRRSSLPKSPLTLPLSLFLVAVAISLVLRYRSYLGDPRGPFPFRETYNEIRPLFAYLTFYVFIFGIRTESQLKRIIIVAFGVSATVGLLMVAQYFVGPGTRLFYGRVEALQEGAATVTRSIPPGLELIQIYFPLAVYLAAKAPLRNSAMYVALAMALGLGIIFSMTRNCWVTRIFSISLMAMIVRRITGTRIAIYGGIVIALALSLSLGL